MAAWIDNTDLQTYEPDILTHGIASFATDIALAQDDVLNRVKSEWWEQHVGLRMTEYGYGTGMRPIMDESLLNTTALGQMTAYQALAKYIMPKLSNFSDEADEFMRRMEFYEARVADEWKKLMNMALYDFNSDSTFSDYERTGPVGVVVRRA